MMMMMLAAAAWAIEIPHGKKENANGNAESVREIARESAMGGHTC